MTLERPLLLLLLAVPAVLLLLRARAARPRAAEASSLLVWRKVSPSDTVPVRPRPPLDAWVEAAGAGLLALGAAGPAGPAAPGPAVVRVLLDGSPSMSARGPGGTSRIEAARAILREPPDGTALDVRTLDDPAGEMAAWTAGGPPVVVVTDHRPGGRVDDPPRLRIVGMGGPGFNAGITRASGSPLPGGGWRLFAAVEVFGARGPVEGTVRVDGAEERVTAAPGRAVEIVRDLPSPSCMVRIEFPGDGFPGDDGAILSRAGGWPVTMERDPDPGLDPLARALEAAGAEAGPTRAGPPSIRLAGRTSGETEEMPPRPVEVRLPAAAGGEEIPARSVVAGDDPLVREVVVDPSGNLGRRGEAGTPGGSVLLSDGAGPLAWARDRGDAREVHLAFLPGGTWVRRDPSFVVLARNLVEEAAGGPARLAAEAVQDARESREAAEGESFGDLRSALAEAARPDPSTRTSFAPALLAAGAALLLAAWVLSR